MLGTRSIVSPEDQRVTFVELFFDLVFVFAVTQVVKVFHHHPDFTGLAQAILVFWLVWWAWTQFAWAMNAADTTHGTVELAMLAATAIAFVMAASLPGAFQDRATWFAVPYVALRALGLFLYGSVAAAADSRQHAAVRLFTLASLTGLAAVLVGAWLGGAAQYTAWGTAIVLDVVAAAIAGRQEGWNLHPAHFAERHGLIVIIALGESLIVAASGAAGQRSGRVITVALLAVAVTAGFWWTYFRRCKPRLDHAVETSEGTRQTKIARDVFSLIHFPLLCGVIAYAAVVEEALTHADQALSLLWRTALSAGLVLFLGGMALALWRGTGQLLWARVVLTLTSAAGVMVLPGTAMVSLGIALAGVTAIALMEENLAPDAS
jgi:low temperature requirement protein LtrA